jgi:methionine aminotransferase
MVSFFKKSFHVTGWKVGHLVAPEHLMKEIKKVHQFLALKPQYLLSRNKEYLDVVSG